MGATAPAAGASRQLDALSLRRLFSICDCKFLRYRKAVLNALFLMQSMHLASVVAAIFHLMTI